MPDPRLAAAWHAEQARQRRERLAYWRGIGEAYLQILSFTLASLAALAAIHHLFQ